MSPFINATLSVIFIVCGLVATLIMLELRGQPKERSINALLIKVHKTFGWIFTSIFILLFMVMIIKVSGYKAEAPPRISTHIALSLALLPLLFFKIIIAHRYPRLSQNLINLGIMVLVIAVVLTGITAGYYFIHSFDIKHVAPTALGEKMPAGYAHSTLSHPIGKSIMETKCVSCHKLDRIIQAKKDKQDWETTINKMIEYNGAPELLTENEKIKLIEFLLNK